MTSAPAGSALPLLLLLCLTLTVQLGQQLEMRRGERQRPMSSSRSTYRRVVTSGGSGRETRVEDVDWDTDFPDSDGGSLGNEDVDMEFDAGGGSGGLDWSVDIGGGGGSGGGSNQDQDESTEGDSGIVSGGGGSGGGGSDGGQLIQGFTVKRLYGDRNDPPRSGYPLEVGPASAVDNSSMFSSSGGGLPQPPQRVRLRGNRSDMNPNEGRVEVFYSGRWGLVCDDHFGPDEANVACHSLGFKGGANRPYSGSFFGTGGYGPQDIRLESLRCGPSGEEAGLHQCSHSHLNRCSNVSTAGVECTYNEGCEFGWIGFDGLCYRVEASLKTPEEAASACESEGATLAYVLSETENNFISNVMYTKFKDIGAVWTGGQFARIERQRSRSRGRQSTEIVEAWIFKDSQHVISADKSMWFPGFGYSSSSTRPQDDGTKSCLALSKIFYNRRTRRDTDVNYFWWDNVSCKTRLPFVCQKLAQTSDCYNGTGLDYKGDAIRTEDGSLCQMWGAENPDWQIRPGRSGSLAASRAASRGRGRGSISRRGGRSFRRRGGSSRYSSSSGSSRYSSSSSSSFGGGGTVVTEHSFSSRRRGFRDDHNYCRNPDRDRKPWCWLDKQNRLYGYCNILRCNSTTRPTSAPSASNLPNASFNSTMCRRPDLFFCPSMVNYRPTCVLRTDVCDGYNDCVGGEDESASFCRSYMCKPEEFYCKKSHRCIPTRRVCDGIPDCDFGDDEQVAACQAHRPEINSPDVSTDLSGYRKTEHIAQPEISDAVTVVAYMSLTLRECKARCDRQGTIPIQCAGFTFVQRGLYDVSECNLLSARLPDLTVGEESQLTYYEKEQRCDSSTQFTCSNGNCVTNRLKCNGFDDCGDFSDEIGPSSCPSPRPTFSVRLSSGKGAFEGRVEVKLFKEWGLVCDGGLDASMGDLICRTLGYSQGYERLVFNARREFGRGSGQFLMSSVNCSGINTSLYDCEHAGWKQGSCSINNIAGLVCRRERACTSKEIRCSDRCVPLSAMCNGVADCPDSSDELACGRMSLRLRDANNSRADASGFLEVVRGNISGAICDDQFGDKEVKVACRQLGFSTGRGRMVPQGTYEVPRDLVMWVNDVICRGSESSLFDCNITSWGSSHCDVSEAVAIQCGLPDSAFTTTRPPTTTRATTTTPRVTTKIAEGAAAATTTATPPRSVGCGARFGRFPTGRIINGYPAISGQYPWQVGIRMRLSSTQNQQWCGGTIINDRWIVSAAHCFEENPKSSYILRIGDLDNTVRESKEREFDVDLMISHPRYTGNPEFDYDIALLRVKPDRLGYISFHDTVQPACLPDRDLVAPRGTECHISGWGSIGSFEPPNNLMAAKVPLIDHTRCNELYSGRITERMQCAGFEAGGIDSCQGDSGGPLVCSINGTFVLMGATSWGEGCAVPGSPGVYANVKNLRDWIDQTIASNP